MADPIRTPGYRYSQSWHTGDGSTVLWNFSFAGVNPGYIQQDHVKVYAVLNGERVAVPFTWETSSRIRVEPAIAAGVTFVIARETPKDAPLVDFINGALLTERNLDMQARQAIYAVAEMVDDFSEIRDDIEQLAAEAVDVALEARGIAEGALARDKNLLDVPDKAQARLNMGLGSMSTKDSANYYTTVQVQNLVNSREPSLGEADAGSVLYGDRQWRPVPGGVSEAPQDGGKYARSMGAWVDIPEQAAVPFGMAVYYPNDLAADEKIATILLPYKASFTGGNVLVGAGTASFTVSSGAVAVATYDGAALTINNAGPYEAGTVLDITITSADAAKELSITLAGIQEK